MAESFELDAAERVTVGTVGVPGQRTFYLQARQGPRVVSLKLEKQQVAALGQLLGELLSDLPVAGALPTELDLEEPGEEAWAVDTMQLAYDRDRDRVVLIATERDDDDEPGAVGRLLVTREQAAALVVRSHELVEAGRPPCPWCGHPLDPAGHSCPRTNGHRPPAL